MVGYRKGDMIQAVSSVYRDVESLRAEHALENQDQDTLRSLLTE